MKQDYSLLWLRLPERNQDAPPPSSPWLDVVSVGPAEFVDRATGNDGRAVGLIDVLDAEVATYREFTAIYNACPVPVVVRLNHDTAELLPYVRSTDEVCYSDEPSAFLAPRIARLFRIADLDPLTDLLCRRAFDRELDAALRSVTASRPLSLLKIDIDHFARINDEFGHSTGDSCLAQLARLLPKSDGTLTARYGGDDFTLLLPGRDEQAILAYAEGLCHSIAEHRFSVAGDKVGINLTVSVGIGAVEDSTDAASLFRQVDAALYEAKAAGRDRAVHYRSLVGDSDSDIDIRTYEVWGRIANQRMFEQSARHLRSLLKSLRQQAEVDTVTGVYSRGYFDRRITRACREARNTIRPLCVALIDIDHFGLVNKTKAGAWVTGDRALREIGNLIRQNLREGDWVARYGGEEFIVVLPEISFESAVQVLERVRVAIARHQFRDENGGAFSVTISAGVATLRSGETQDEVLPRLCKKVLAAKSAGRNQVRG